MRYHINEEWYDITPMKGVSTNVAIVLNDWTLLQILRSVVVLPSLTFGLASVVIVCSHICLFLTLPLCDSTTWRLSVSLILALLIVVLLCALCYFNEGHTVTLMDLFLFLGGQTWIDSVTFYNYFILKRPYSNYRKWWLYSANKCALNIYIQGVSINHIGS